MLDRMLKVSLFKRAYDLFAEGRSEEAKEILEELQAEYVDICGDVKFLRNQLAEVAEVVDMADSLDFDGQKYWLMDDLNKKGPYCQLCYDRDGLLIRLQEKDANWLCLACGNLYAKAGRDHSDALEHKKTNVSSGVIPLFVK